MQERAGGYPGDGGVVWAMGPFMALKSPCSLLELTAYLVG